MTAGLSPSAREWRWAAGWSLALVLLSAAPYLLAGLAAPDGWRFAGLLVNPLDGQSYMAKMQQGATGSWLFHLTYTPEPHRGAFTFSFYLALGHLAGLLSLPNPLVFHAARLLAGWAMLLAVFKFVAQVTPHPGERRLAFGLLLTASGLGWLGLLLGAFPIDLWVPEAFVPYSLYANPHFPLGIGLMALIFSQILQADAARAVDFGVTALLALMLALVLPFALLTVWAVLVVFLGWRYVAAGRRLPARQSWLTLSAVVAPLPVMAYFYRVSVSNPIFAGWSAQNITPAPNVIDVALGYGLVGLLAVAGGWRVIRQKENNPGEWLALLWALTTLGLVYFPFELQRRLITGLHVPLCILAALGLTHWLAGLKLKPRRRRQIVASVIGVGAAGTLFIWSLPLLAATQPPGSSYGSSLLFVRADEQAAFNWLAKNTRPEAVVLASPRVSMFIPGQTRARTYYGHPFETVNAAAKKAQAEAFFRGELAAPPELVDFVFYGPAEQALGRPAALNQLPVVYANATVTIYQHIRGTQ